MMVVGAFFVALHRPGVFLVFLATSLVLFRVNVVGAMSGLDSAAGAFPGSVLASVLVGICFVGALWMLITARHVPMSDRTDAARIAASRGRE